MNFIRFLRHSISNSLLLFREIIVFYSENCMRHTGRKMQTLKQAIHIVNFALHARGGICSSFMSWTNILDALEIFKERSVSYLHLLDVVHTYTRTQK